MRWRIELLGGLRVQRGPQLLSPLRARKAAALLAYLTFHRGPHERELLAELLWPTAEPQAARNRLRVALSALRANLGDEITTTIGSTLVLVENYETDVGDFKTALEGAKTRVGPAQIAHWQTAFELYKGRLLPGFFESWVPAADAQLEENFVQTARALMAQLGAVGQHQRALDYGQRALSLAPLREELCGDLMQMHADLGQSANAVRLYRELEERLRAQLQTAPSPALCALKERLLVPKSEADEATASQVGRTDKKLAQAATSWLNDAPELPLAPDLPPRWTRFFGRESEIDNLRQSLGGDQTRLVTLTGNGGIGKTRLALESARVLQELWPQCVWFVPLHELGESAHVTAQIQCVLELPPQRDENATLEIIAQSLNAKPVLLVLDNFEQLLPWGTPVVQWLLDNSPHLRLLVTSRAPLKIAGETVLSLSALTIPTLELAPDELMEYGSVQLFADRARIADPNFRLTQHNARSVAELCAQLEGWPLALELAGAQAGTLRPHQMLKRLRKRLDFLQSASFGTSLWHGSLRAVLEWSYELLRPDARRFFARLSVFRGAFDEEAAREIGEEPAAAHHLDRLVTASLVVAEDKRFRLLETLREFAREQLSNAELEALQRRHAHYFLGLAQNAPQCVCRCPRRGANEQSGALASQFR